MKIVVPQFMMPVIQAETCALLQTCDFVTITPEGQFATTPEDAEVVVLPWHLPAATQATLLQLPTVRWIHSISAGVDHVLDEGVRAHPAVLTNARDVFAIPIAEMVVAYILMIVKRLPEFLANQREGHWRKLALREAAGLTVGIIGLGSIGAEIAHRCSALGMRVIATRRQVIQPIADVALLLPPERLAELLTAADFIVIATPLTPETRGMIGVAQLQLMRASAWFINIARGPIVDEEALIQALHEGWIAGAALDVFAQEPLPVTSPLWQMSNVILTPHNSWNTPHLEEREATLFIANLQRYLRGEPLQNVIDKTRGY